MIEELIAELYKTIGHSWTIGGRELIPTEDDVREVLDSAAAALYTSDVGSQFMMRGLIIVKTEDGFDAYPCVGNYR